jgi:aspartyl-tRNA(Asn)/glutamyl-tRNA(Gln) amidotransferase subunit B
VFTETNDPILSSTWVAIELTNLINEHQLNIENIDNWIIDFLIKIINSIKNKKINYSQAKIVWHQSYQTKKNPELIIKELNFDKKITIEETKSLLLKYFHENNEIRIKHREQPEKIIKYFIGLLMKETKGQADPIAANKILKEILN